MRIALMTKWNDLPTSMTKKSKMVDNFALRYVRILPGVNSRAELVGVNSRAELVAHAPGLRLMSRGETKSLIGKGGGGGEYSYNRVMSD